MRSTALNVKSEYSPGSLVRIEGLLDRVHELKMNTAGLADRATLLGIPHFLSAARRRGLQVLLGVELPLLSSVPEEAAAGVAFPLVVRVASPSAPGASEGLRLLHRLVERAESSAGAGSNSRADLSLEDVASELTAARTLAAASPGAASFELIAQSPGQTGEVSVRILRGQMDLAERLALRLAEVFGRSCFFPGISIHGASNGGASSRSISTSGGAGTGGNAGRARAGGRPTELELRLARETLALARRLDLTVAASNEVDQLHVQDAAARRVYDGMMRAEGSGRHRALPPDVPTDIRSGEEFEQLFNSFPEALEGLDLLTARCRMEPTAQLLAPLVGLLGGEGPGDEAGITADLERRLAVRSRTAPARARLRSEMDVIRRNGLAVPLLVLERVFPGGELSLHGASGSERIARLPEGFLAGSWVAYQLGLTPVDPLRHRLPMRFPAGWLESTPSWAGGAQERGEGQRSGVPVTVEVIPGRQSDLDARLQAFFGAESLIVPVRVERHDAGSALFEAAARMTNPGPDRAPGLVIAPALVERAVQASRGLPPEVRLGADAIVSIFQNDPHLARAYHQDERMQDWFDTARRIVGSPRCFHPDTGARFLAVRVGHHAADGGVPLHPLVVDARPVARLTTDQTGFEPLLSLRLVTPRARPDTTETLDWMRVLRGNHRNTIPDSTRLLDAVTRKDAVPRKDAVTRKNSTTMKEVSMSLAPLPAGAASAPAAGFAPAPSSPDDRIPTHCQKAAATAVAPKGRLRAGGRYEPLAVIEREDTADVPSLRDATDAVALTRLAGRRDSVVRVFLQRRAAATPIDCGDSTISRILASTHGLLIYDEQVIDLAVRLAGFTALEAEAFRRGLITEGGPAAATWRVRFVQGAVERGHTVARAEGFFASIRQSAAGTVSRGECVAEAMRILREAYGFGAARDGRAGGAQGADPGAAALNRNGAGQGRGVLPLRRGLAQLSLPWLDLVESSEGMPVEDGTLRRRA